MNVHLNIHFARKADALRKQLVEYIWKVVTQLTEHYNQRNDRTYVLEDEIEMFDQVEMDGRMTSVTWAGDRTFTVNVRLEASSDDQEKSPDQLCIDDLILLHDELEKAFNSIEDEDEEPESYGNDHDEIDPNPGPDPEGILN